jgi:hypothetical protein
MPQPCSCCSLVLHSRWQFTPLQEQLMLKLQMPVVSHLSSSFLTSALSKAGAEAGGADGGRCRGGTRLPPPSRLLLQGAALSNFDVALCWLVARRALLPLSPRLLLQGATLIEFDSP